MYKNLAKKYTKKKKIYIHAWNLLLNNCLGQRKIDFCLPSNQRHFKMKSWLISFLNKNRQFAFSTESQQRRPFLTISVTSNWHHFDVILTSQQRQIYRHSILQTNVILTTIYCNNNVRSSTFYCHNYVTTTSF